MSANMAYGQMALGGVGGEHEDPDKLARSGPLKVGQMEEGTMNQQNVQLPLLVNQRLRCMLQQMKLEREMNLCMTIKRPNCSIIIQSVFTSS